MGARMSQTTARGISFLHRALSFSTPPDPPASRHRQPSLSLPTAHNKSPSSATNGAFTSQSPPPNVLLALPPALPSHLCSDHNSPRGPRRLRRGLHQLRRPRRVHPFPRLSGQSPPSIRQGRHGILRAFHLLSLFHKHTGVTAPLRRVGPPPPRRPPPSPYPARRPPPPRPLLP